MRQVLVDHARKRVADKRGGSYQRVPLDDVLDQIEDQKLDVLDLNEAVEELERLYPRQAHVVSLRFFGGMTNKEVGAQLGLSETTIENDFKAARAFLHSRLTDEEGPGHESP
jgi:RNA polymerase sigma factor (TIGR02999 family)